MLWRPAHHRRLVQLADAITTAFSFIAAYFALIWARIIFPWAPIGRDIEITPDLYWKIVVFAIIWVLVVLTKLGAYTGSTGSMKRQRRMVPSGARSWEQGGGGFFMFYCEEHRSRLRKAMAEEGLREMRYRFDFEGSKVLINLFNPRDGWSFNH